MSEHKRELILAAAREIFEAEGLEGASLRAIAARAGYTPAALYFHFPSKEAIYAELLLISLSALGDAIRQAASGLAAPQEQLRAAAMGFFSFYFARPRDLDLGFYLFHGGMRPAGLGPDYDEVLNAALTAALSPITEAAEALGTSVVEANMLTADIFAHAVGLLLLAHTRRIRLFGAAPQSLMEAHLDDRLSKIGERRRRDV